MLQKTPDTAWPRWKTAVYYGYRILLLAGAGFCLGLALLILATGPYSKWVAAGYLGRWETMLLNALPPALLALLFYALLGRAWLSFLLSGLACWGLSMGNYYKIHFRSDPVYFEDLFNLREASNMAGAGHYSLFIDRKILLATACLILGTVLLRLLAPGKKRSLPAAGISAAAAVVTAVCLVPAYMDSGIYNGIDNFEHLNQWNPSQNYIAHGFLYPFFHSASELIDTPPDGYSSAKAEAMLSAYQDAEIPEKIHIIAIMREAYADFSQYGVEGLDPGCYELYHQLEAESYTGDLVTNIFGGGTVDTERCFLTGSYEVKNYRANTNSYLWYLRQQGYTVEGCHPYYQWFYNRLNINGYIGFERYRFWEDDFEHLTDALLPEDAVLYPEVYADFQAHKDKPYFSFVLNVQSHGPYWTGEYGGDTEYLTGNRYSQECRNAMNNYMNSIMDSDAELLKFIGKLRDEPEPVVLVTFGDHLPWMGDSEVFYDEMGIDIDAGSEEGFFRHYSTRYLIWANDAAETLLGREIQGEGPRISPCYLMGLLFQQLGWEGPAYMQAMNDLMEVIPVDSTTGRMVIDGSLTTIVPPERQDFYEEFKFLQYYWRHKWLYQDCIEK